MKILCVVPSYWPAFKYGGPIQSLHILNKELVKKGIDLTVYTTNAGLEGKVTVNQEVKVDGVKVYYFEFIKFFEFLGKTGWQFSPQMSRALKNNLGFFDLAYIVAIWNYPVTVAAHFCRQYKKPYIIAPRGLLYPYSTSIKFWKKWLYYVLVIKKAINDATLIHYTTNDEAKECHMFLRLKNKLAVVPNGLDLTEFANLPDRENFKIHYPQLRNKKVILFLGRINWKKGLDILAKAYGRIARQREYVHLLIVGNDESGYEKRVKRWLKEERVLDKVTFTGMLTGKEKLRAYTASDIFVLPSYSENFGMSVIEAMACGIPVVISDQVGIHREVSANNAGVIVECNEESVGKGVKSILDNKNFAEELSFNAKKMVREYYSIDNVADKMIETYRQILNA